jgi:hypothetical protein
MAEGGGKSFGVFRVKNHNFTPKNLIIIITGDFNINQFGNNTTKTDNLLAQFSFHPLITEPTYVTERISSLLDLVLVNNSRSILYSEVGLRLVQQG